MNLKEFVSQAIQDIIQAVDEASGKSSRDAELAHRQAQRTIEFDIAVSAESTDSKAGKAGIRVLQFAEAGGNLSVETKNSTVSRIVFGIDVDTSTKQERTHQQQQFEALQARRSSSDEAY